MTFEMSPERYGMIQWAGWGRHWGLSKKDSAVTFCYLEYLLSFKQMPIVVCCLQNGPSGTLDTRMQQQWGYTRLRKA